MFIYNFSFFPILVSRAGYFSLVVRKPAFCIIENKDADQLRGNREADQRLCFRYSDSTIPLLSKSKISRLLPSSVTAQPGLCRTWSETPKTGFLRTRLMCSDSACYCSLLIFYFCVTGPHVPPFLILTVWMITTHG